VRDLKKDLEICQKATPGKWSLWPEKCGPEGQSVIHDDTGGVICDVGDPYPRGANRPQQNMEFIVAAHEGWPEAINRALQSEKTAESRQRTLDDIYAKTERLYDWARENLTGVLVEQFWSICANGSLIGEEPRYHQRFNYMKYRAESAEAEVEKLRKTLALAHSMILGGEQYTEQSRQIIEGALGLL